MQQRIVPSLRYDTEAEEAARFHTAMFPNSRFVSVTRCGEAGPREAGTVMTSMPAVVKLDIDALRRAADGIS